MDLSNGVTSASANQFLRDLAPVALNLIRPRLSRVSLKRNDRLSEIGGPVSKITFPISCVLGARGDGPAGEGRMIGREGAFGFLEALGGMRAVEQVSVEMEGEALQMSTRSLTEAARLSPQLMHTIIRYAQEGFRQVSAAGACHAHRVTPRLATLLLTLEDRLEQAVFVVTHDELAEALRVQRTTVTVSADALRRAGLIRYRRGALAILDKAGLRKRACSCFRPIGSLM